MKLKYVAGMKGAVKVKAGARKNRDTK